MSKLFIEESSLTAIGDAIRNKTGGSELLSPSAMVTAIEGIETGGGGGTELPDEAFVISGDCQYRLAYDGWNWFIDLFGDKITTKDISSLASFAYAASNITEIPFTLNIKTNCHKISNMFSGCGNLINVPRISGALSLPTGDYSGTVDMSSLFSTCGKLREIPYDYFHSFGGSDYWTAAQNYQGGRSTLFGYCYSLRALPDISMLSTTSDYYSSLYQSLCQQCFSLDEVRDLPVLAKKAFTSNAFNNTFYQCGRLKTVTFQTNEDGSPIVANWKNQVIDLSSYVGYVRYATDITNRNNGLTTATQIKDDATYQALKDNPDSWCAGYGYSRYNHDSAVETINTLPDVSGSGSTNTIKFFGASGALTDGGAINTLTEEEIAVAATKGWTVTLV